MILYLIIFFFCEWAHYSSRFDGVSANAPVLMIYLFIFALCENNTVRFLQNSVLLL